MEDDVFVAIHCARLGLCLARGVEVEKASLPIVREVTAVVRVAVLSEKPSRLAPITPVCLGVSHDL